MFLDLFIRKKVVGLLKEGNVVEWVFSVIVGIVGIVLSVACISYIVDDAHKITFLAGFTTLIAFGAFLVLLNTARIILYLITKFLKNKEKKS